MRLQLLHKGAGASSSEIGKILTFAGRNQMNKGDGMRQTNISRHFFVLCSFALGLSYNSFVRLNST